VIKDFKMYLFKDGYDDPMTASKKLIQADPGFTRLELDAWPVKINGQPDYAQITDRRLDTLKRHGEEYVSKNFQNFYKNVRNEFLIKHASIFRHIMINRTDSGLYVERKPIPPALNVGSLGDSSAAPVKYMTIVAGKSVDDKKYYAEDMDGDGFAETFYVSVIDGFNWGFKSGPNIIFIYRNTDPEIKEIIGTLTHEAYFGTTQEEEAVKKSMNDNFKKNVATVDKGSSKNYDDREIVEKWIDLVVGENIKKIRPEKKEKDKDDGSGSK
jgi:hypothetical protein